MSTSLFSFSGADISRPSKVKGTFLPQEYEMARFLANISNPHPSWRPTTTLCEWHSVYCDEEKRVNYIDLGATDLFDTEYKYFGTLAWSHMPRTTDHFVMSDQEGVTGTLPIAYLPIALTRFLLLSCDLFGFVDLTILPPGLRRSLTNNRFCGTLDLTSLPATLVSLDLYGNEFEGPVDLSKLPASLKDAVLSGNKLYAITEIPSFINYKF
mmetsp:Transcript_318/g.443  ORF Transcript_318/g.443 Transcript_318/m.443 type:complete len:211 (+) Transcript_318:92-724(+)